MGKTKYGVLIESIYQPAELIAIAKQVEDLKFIHFWYPDEKFFKDCYIGLCLVAQNTRNISLGPCVTDPYSRHPIMTAAAIASLAEVAPNRTWLGIGAGGRGFQAIGVDRDRPAIAIREAVFIIRELLSGKTVDYKGEVISLHERSLDFKPIQHVPIMIATGHGRFIQSLAGEIGDAVMLANFSSPPTILAALENVKKGANKSRRNLKDIFMILRVDVAVHPDKSVAKRSVAPIILSAMRASYPELAYLDVLPDFKMSSEFLKVLGKHDYKSRTFYRNPENSAPLIPPELYENLALVGEPKEVSEKIKAIIDLDIFDEITIRPVPAGEQTIQECVNTIHQVLV
jgi:5,10-methylenetetrahydromethanopterin reductase